MPECSQCHVDKPGGEFYRYPSGYQRRECQVCNVKRMKAHWDKIKAGPSKVVRKKKCAVCHEKKPAKAFGKNSWMPDNLSVNCQVCALQKHVTRRYGLSAADYKALRAKHRECCAICGRHESTLGDQKYRTLHVDHDHTTGKVRGLLCYKCNTGVGQFNNDPKILLAAATYLKASGTP